MSRKGSGFVEVNDKVKHRPMNQILADLTAARTEREQADQDLAEVLAKLDLTSEG